MARPRIYLDNTSPLARSREAASARGAKLKQIRLEADELDALDRVREVGETDRDCIARLIITAAKRKKAPPARG